MGGARRSSRRPGNSIGVLAWGRFAAVGIATVIATSVAAFELLVELVGAAALVVIGLPGRLLRPAGLGCPRSCGWRAPRGGHRVGASRELRERLITSLANPKSRVFFVASFPQFIPRGAAVLPSALAMAAVIVAVDLVWYSTLALLVARARKAFVAGGWGRRIERLSRSRADRPRHPSCARAALSDGRACDRRPGHAVPVPSISTCSSATCGRA